MFDPAVSDMQASTPSHNSGHPSADMYYTNVLFGHPLFAPSALRRNRDADIHDQQAVVQGDGLLQFTDDFIELDVRSDSAPTFSGDEIEDHNLSNVPPTSSLIEYQSNSPYEPSQSTSVSLMDPPLSTDVNSNSPTLSTPLQPTIDVAGATCNSLSGNRHDDVNQTLPISSFWEQSQLPIPDRNDYNSSPINCVSHQSPSVLAYSLNSSDCDVFLMRQNDIAPGNSMTSTVVNLLRGCNLLDSYTLEDLCSYLPILRRKDPYLTSNLLTVPTPKPSTSCDTIRQQIQKRSSSLPSRLPHPTFNEVTTKSTVSTALYGGRLVDYLLTCSRLGSTALSDFLPLESDETTCTRSHLLPLDWRRGRSDGLVCIATASRSLRSRVVGRFVTDWKSCASPGFRPHTDSLGRWLAEWIRVGAVVFFAQLDAPQKGLQSLSSPPTRCQNTLNASGDGIGGGCCELAWRHRLVYGVTGYSYVHLSNPIETVHIASLLAALRVPTSICIPKVDLLKLWDSDEALSQKSCTRPPSKFDQDLSLLVQHDDPRWRQFNILGS